MSSKRVTPVSNTPPASPGSFPSGLDGESQFVYGETRSEFYTLQNEYTRRFQPASPEERFHVDTLIRNEWMLRRMFRAEAHLWEYHAIRANSSEGVQLGEGFDKASPVFMRLQRRMSMAERSYKESFQELQRLQAARRAPSPQPAHDPAPAPAPATTTAPTNLPATILSDTPSGAGNPARRRLSGGVCEGPAGPTVDPPPTASPCTDLAGRASPTARSAGSSPGR